MTYRVYRGSDGRYYGNVDVWERLERGDWAPCCWDSDSGTEWIETADGSLLTLTPSTPAALPPHRTTTTTCGGFVVEAAPPHRPSASRRVPPNG